VQIFEASLNSIVQPTDPPNFLEDISSKDGETSHLCHESRLANPMLTLEFDEAAAIG
jgi:hypothetical protein